MFRLVLTGTVIPRRSLSALFLHHLIPRVQDVEILVRIGLSVVHIVVIQRLRRIQGIVHVWHDRIILGVIVNPIRQIGVRK